MPGRRHKSARHRDPVCEKIVEEGFGVKETYKGRAYILCSTECQRVFQEYPETYTARKEEVHRA